MPSTFSTNLKVELIAPGEKAGTWGGTANTNFGVAVEEAITGIASIVYPTDANLTLTFTDTNSTQEFRNLVLNVSGALTEERDLVVPTITKQYLIWNNTTGDQSIAVKTAAGSSVTVPNGAKMHLMVDGAGVVPAVDTLPAGTTVGGTDLVTTTDTQTLTNKTINASTNTITNVSLTTGVTGTLPIANGGTSATTAANARTSLGLGTVATQAADNVAITGGDITGITDITVADGGTGASSFTANNILLGNGASPFQVVAPGTAGNVLRSNGTTWQAAANTADNLSYDNTLSALTATDVQDAIDELNIVGSAYDPSNVALTATNTQDAIDELCTLPPQAKAADYTLAATDVGGVTSISAGTITVPPSVFAAGDVVVIYNNAADARPIARGVGVTMYWVSASNANRTLAARGVATILCVAADTFVITGQGLS